MKNWMGVKQQTNKSIVLSKNCINLIELLLLIFWCFYLRFSEKWRENSTECLNKITVPECPHSYMKQTQDYYVKIHSASARKRGTLYKCTNADIQMMLEKKVLIHYNKFLPHPWKKFYIGNQNLIWLKASIQNVYARKDLQKVTWITVRSHKDQRLIFFQFVESAGQSGSSYSKDFKEGDPDPDSKTLLPDHIVAICISLALLAISVTSGITLFFLRKHVKFRSHQQNLS